MQPLSTTTFHHADIVGSPKETSLSQNASNLTSKVTDFVTPYLSVNYWTQKIRNCVRAKVLPLSASQGWAEEMSKTKQEVARYQAMKPAVQQELGSTRDQIVRLEALRNDFPHKFYGTHQQKQLEDLYSSREILEKRIQTLTRNLDTAQIKIQHLGVLHSSQIGGQLAGWTGKVCNVLYPGSGMVVSLAMVAWATALREKDAKKICDVAEDKEFAMQNKRKIRIATYQTVACTIASMCFFQFKDAFILVNASPNGPGLK